MNKKSQIIIKKIEGEEIKLQAKIFSVEESAFKIIDEEKGIFEAYVSVFGNTDSYGEVVEKGAFVEWLSIHKGRYPKGVWAHNWAEPIIKTLEIGEDDHGLKVKGQFVLEVQRAREIYALMKEGVITDFSFGFRVQEDAWDEVAKVRRLKKIAIYEYSPVLVGANDQATLLGVKADGDTIVEDAPADAPADPETPVVDAPVDEPVIPAEGETPAPAEETPSPSAADDAGDTPTGDTPAGDEAPAAEDPKGLDAKAGRVLSSKNRTAIQTAIDGMKAATDALEALIEATEDDDDGKSSDTSQVETHEGKGSNERLVIRGILRDARKADKVLEKIIIRAKQI